MFGYTTRGSLTNGMHIEDLVPIALRERHIQHRVVYRANPSTRPMGLGLNAYGQRLDGSLFPIAVSLSSEIISGVVYIAFSVQVRAAS